MVGESLDVVHFPFLWYQLLHWCLVWLTKKYVCFCNHRLCTIHWLMLMQIANSLTRLGKYLRMSRLQAYNLIW
jgi:hypothetical protein